MVLILAQPLRFTGSLTHGSFPVELSRSPESMWTAAGESQLSLQGKQAAWDPAWLLSQPMCCSEICQLQFGFFPQWGNFLSEISSQLCSVLLLLLQMRKPKWPREPHRGKAQSPGWPGIMAGLQSWRPQTNHKHTSEMSDITSRTKYAYSLYCDRQNSACALPGTLNKGFYATLYTSDKKFCFLIES